MIIDDEPEIHHQLQSLIGEEDILIKTVENTRKALDVMKDDSSISLLLVNTTVPDKNIPAYFPVIPDSTKFMDLNNEKNFLSKPFSRDQFLNFIDQSLKQSRDDR
jgi:DNA-binding NtrC family response regulator